MSTVDNAARRKSCTGPAGDFDSPCSLHLSNVSGCNSRSSAIRILEPAIKEDLKGRVDIICYGLLWRRHRLMPCTINDQEKAPEIDDQTNSPGSTPQVKMQPSVSSTWEEERLMSMMEQRENGFRKC